MIYSDSKYSKLATAKTVAKVGEYVKDNFMHKYEVIDKSTSWMGCAPIGNVFSKVNGDLSFCSGTFGIPLMVVKEYDKLLFAPNAYIKGDYQFTKYVRFASFYKDITVNDKRYFIANLTNIPSNFNPEENIHIPSYQIIDPKKPCMIMEWLWNSDNSSYTSNKYYIYLHSNIDREFGNDGIDKTNSLRGYGMFALTTKQAEDPDAVFYDTRKTYLLFELHNNTDVEDDTLNTMSVRSIFMPHFFLRNGETYYVSFGTYAEYESNSMKEYEVVCNNETFGDINLANVPFYFSNAEQKFYFKTDYNDCGIRIEQRVAGELKKIDEKYLPEGIVATATEPEEDELLQEVFG